MLKRRTIFVVGAGASCEFNFPSGAALVNSIYNLLAPESEGRPTEQQAIFREAMVYSAKDKRKDVNEYFRSGRVLRRSLPLAVSIDNVLHTHGHIEDIVSIGKLAIASCLNESERRSSLSAATQPEKDHVNFLNLSDTWLTVLAKGLFAGVSASDVESVFDNVAFVSFNYDRCIEHFFRAALTSYFNISLDDAVALVEKLRIVYPYGHLGNLPSTTFPSGSRFGEQSNWQLLRAMAKCLSREFLNRMNHL